MDAGNCGGCSFGIACNSTDFGSTVSRDDNDSICCAFAVLGYDVYRKGDRSGTCNMISFGFIVGRGVLNGGYSFGIWEYGVDRINDDSSTCNLMDLGFIFSKDGINSGGCSYDSA